jgi:autotransporter-associated beta strand protein
LEDNLVPRLDASCVYSTSLTIVTRLRRTMELVLVGLACASAEAGETWDGGGSNDYWTTGANWNGIGFPPLQLPPPNNGAANIVMPAVTGLVQTPIVDVPYSINSLTFNADSGSGRFVILCAEQLTIGAGGITNYDADMQSVIGPVMLSAHQTWAAEGTGRMQFDSVNLNGRGLTLLPTNGPIDMIGSLSGSGHLVIKGGDYGLEPVTITGIGNSTFTGTTSVDIHGRLNLNKPAGSTAVAGNLTIGYSADVWLYADEQISHAPGIVVSEVAEANLRLNGHTETIADLYLSPYSDLIADGGKLIVGERIRCAPSWNSGSARITGNVDLNGGVREITGIDSSSEIYDQLVIDGVISNGGATFDHNVILRGAANTYTGTTLVRPNGNVLLEKSAADGAFRGDTTIQGIARLGANEQIFANVFLDGGTLRLDTYSETVQDLTMRDGTVAGPGTLSATGIVTVQAGGGDSIIDASVNLQGTRNFDVQADAVAASADLTIHGPVSNGAVWKTGGGTMGLNSSANTYAGGTTVSAGTLLVTNASGSGTGTGAVTVNDGGTLGGAGIINTSATNASVTVASGGSLSPGTSAGTLTLVLGSGSLNLSEVTTGGLKFELGAPSTPAASDHVVVNSGTLNIGTLDFSDFTFTNVGGIAVGTYTLFDAQTDITGSIGTASGSVGSFAATISVDNTLDDVLLTVTGLAGDYNANSVVDAADYVIWRKLQGTATTLPNDPHGGTIGSLQFDNWRANFGNMAGSGASTSAIVPESRSVLLLLLGAVVARSRRRRIRLGFHPSPCCPCLTLSCLIDQRF